MKMMCISETYMDDEDERPLKFRLLEFAELLPLK